MKMFTVPWRFILVSVNWLMHRVTKRWIDVALVVDWAQNTNYLTALQIACMPSEGPAPCVVLCSGLCSAVYRPV